VSANERALPASAADRRFWYGDDPGQFADLYLPPGAGPHPVLALLHGGCWRAQYGLEPLGSLCRALAEAGFAAYNLEYRRPGQGGGWPHTFRDAARGIDALRDLAETCRLDLARVVASGHSAGGHLALWLAGRWRLPPTSPLYFPDPLPIKGVLALAAIPDLVGAAREGICQEMPAQLMGGTPAEVPERYRQASPLALLPTGCPQIHIIGDQDDPTHSVNIRRYVAAAREIGEPARLMIAPGAGHFELVNPAAPAWSLTLAALAELLR